LASTTTPTNSILDVLARSRWATERTRLHKTALALLGASHRADEKTARRSQRKSGKERFDIRERESSKSADEKNSQDDEHNARYEMNEDHAEPVDGVVVQLNTI